MPATKNGGTQKTAAGIGDDAVQAKTGKTWAQWFALLDKAGAKKLSHKEIAAYVHDKMQCPPWWSQMVTVAYEQARGRRKKYEAPDGYQTSASKTLHAAAKAIFQAWVDDKIRSRWLPEAPLTISKATPNKSVRIRWDGGKSSADVGLFPKGSAKCQVAIGHRKLKDARESVRMKKYWTEALGRLQKLLNA
jgi:uncharacterized protein YndB with AHSA1/START domain